MGGSAATRTFRMNVGRAVLVLPMAAAAPDWFGEAAAAGVDVVALGPRRWLLCSDEHSGAELITAWQPRLQNAAHVFEDCGDRFTAIAVQAANVNRLSQQLLQPLDGLTVGSAITTLLGDISVVCHVRRNCVDVLVDRSLAHYAQQWLRQTLADA